MTVSPWTIERTGYTDDGATIELRKAVVGKGRARCTRWLIYRDGTKVGYAATAADAEVNFHRAVAGLTRDTDTGKWVPATS